MSTKIVSTVVAFLEKFPGGAPEKRNQARRTVKFTPIIGHNIKNYELHHTFLALRECDPTSTISVIPSTDKKHR